MRISGVASLSEGTTHFSPEAHTHTQTHTHTNTPIRVSVQKWMRWKVAGARQTGQTSFAPVLRGSHAEQ